ncbi:MAG: 30S ribosomal protein S9, partial [Sulfolobales archaeon]|nr:30S ribosomal protein S9 [Sulfolobales archaeon]
MPEGVILSSAKRKTAIARCVLRPGKGRVLVNGVPLELIPMEMVRMKIMEPLMLAGEKIKNSIDAEITVEGGGVMGQADAARMALARALVKFTNSQELRELFMVYDRSMLAGDKRR